MSKFESEMPEKNQTSSETISLEELYRKILDFIPDDLETLSDDEMDERKNNLVLLPYKPGIVVSTLTDFEGIQQGLMFVETDKIVGSTSPSYTNWSFEYSGKIERIKQVARALADPNPESLEYVFEVAEKDKGIRLKRITGPAGDLFFVKDGTHRVAGCKLAGLPEIPANVEDVSNPESIVTQDYTLRCEWQERIDAGLVDGVITDINHENGQKEYLLKINKQVLPWVVLPQAHLVSFSKFYLQMYPDSLNGLRNLKTGEIIPQEIFTDIVANNRYHRP